jgi:hypothetical protein
MGFIGWLLGKRRKSPANRQVHCGEHGTYGPAFVCRHAKQGAGLGFYVASSPNPDKLVDGNFDDCPNGWCAACEKKRILCGGWNDESEAFAGVTLVCTRCFEEIRRRNTIGNEVA